MLNNPERKDGQYINKVGFDGAFRLHILNEVHGAYSREFLQRIGLTKGMSVLDIGCGTGTMSCWIASQIGSEGKVYAVDFSAEQIHIAKKNAQLKGINNIVFIHASVYDIDKFNIFFDLIYSRYFILHLGQIEKALDILFSKLNSDGIIACEEPTISTGFCYPFSEPYKKSRQLMAKLAEIEGLDFEIGLKLREKLDTAGFTGVDINLVQPTLKNSYERMLMGLMVKECEQNYIKHNLSTRDEISSLIRGLDEISHDEKYLIGFPRTTQAYGQKSL